MKFTKEKLVEIADYIIDYWADKESRRKIAWEAYQADREDRWIKNTRPKLVEYRDQLTKALKNPVVTPGMVNGTSISSLVYCKPEYGMSNFEWDGEKFRDSAYARELDYAEELKALMEYCEDGPVMAGDLTKFGFNPKLLAEMIKVVALLKHEQEALEEYRNQKAKRDAEKQADAKDDSK